jgi:hypothetical protein
LHRRGSRENLLNDFVFQAFTDPAVEAQHFYHGSLEERFKKLVKLGAKYNPVALAPKSTMESPRYLLYWDSSMDSGIHRSSNLTEVITSEKIGNVINAVYRDRNSLERLLREVKRMDLGISITISGLFDVVFDVCKNVGLKPNAVQISLGTWGRNELLPEDHILELCTMCGHGKISAKLAQEMVRYVNKGKLTADEAAVELGKQCLCNIFNTDKGKKIFLSNKKGK